MVTDFKHIVRNANFVLWCDLIFCAIIFYSAWLFYKFCISLLHRLEKSLKVNDSVSWLEMSVVEKEKTCALGHQLKGKAFE